MYDAWGDGWGGQFMTVSDSNGNIVLGNVSVVDGREHLESFCGRYGETYTVSVTDGSYNGDVGWKFTIDFITGEIMCAPPGLVSLMYALC